MVGRALFGLIGLGLIGISVNLLLAERQVVSAIIALLLGVVFCYRAITGQFYLGRGMRPPHSF